MKKGMFLFILITSASLGYPVDPLVNGQMQNAGAYPQPPNIALNAGAKFSPMPPMTEEDMLRVQQEMDAEISKFVSTLPPEQQEQFHKDVEELTNVMSKMSEQELTQFIEQVFTPEEALIAEQPLPQPTLIVEEKKVEEKPVENNKDLEALNKAIKMLNNLITRTERFLRKTQMVPELPGKISRWVSKDVIKEWQADLTWSTLKSDIEKLDQKLHTIKENVDPKTKKNRHVPDLIKNESLYNTLNTLSATLTKHEPNVEAPELGIGSVSKDSRVAIKAVLGGFAESIYTQEVNQELDKLIALYEPQAKVHRESEEKSKNRALESSKNPRRESPRKEALSPVKSGINNYTAPNYYGTGSNSYNAPSYNSGYNTDNYASNYGTDTNYTIPATTPATDKRGATRKPEIKNELGLPEEKKSDTLTKGKSIDNLEKEEFIDDPKFNKSLREIEKQIDKALDIIKENETFKEIDKFINSPEKTDIDPTLVTDIQTITRALRQAIDALKAFNTRLNTVKVEQRNHYFKKLQWIIDESDTKKAFADLNRRISEVINKKDSLSPAKQYAYFDNKAHKGLKISEESENEEESSVTIDSLIKQPANLETLQKNLEDWFKVTKAIKK